MVSNLFLLFSQYSMVLRPSIQSTGLENARGTTNLKQNIQLPTHKNEKAVLISALLLFYLLCITFVNPPTNTIPRAHLCL